MEARHAGEVAYLKLHHQEQMEELWTNHGAEVERIIGEHEEAMRRLDEGTYRIHVCRISFRPVSMLCLIQTYRGTHPL